MSENYVTLDICTLKHKEVDEIKEENKLLIKKLDRLIMIAFGCLATLAVNAVLMYLRS